MIGVQTAAIDLAQRHRLRGDILGQIVTGGAPGREDGLAPGEGERLIRDDGDDRFVQTSVAAAEREQIAGDVNGVLALHRDLRHASVGPHLERVEDEGAKTIEAVLGLEVA